MHSNERPRELNDRIIVKWIKAQMKQGARFMRKGPYMRQRIENL